MQSWAKDRSKLGSMKPIGGYSCLESRSDSSASTPTDPTAMESKALSLMFSRFFRLQEVHSEPWRVWESCLQADTDHYLQFLFKTLRL
ncbi:hypothetical protein LI328DRAFT_94768 [Trichoderma asperelloides]|nr:hypothetical protein LI328DRAFT_94768 [Trichoderma asperelloides]